MKHMKWIGLALLLGILAGTACNKQDDVILTSSHDIVIANGRILSPKWLVHEMKAMADRYNPSPGTGEKPLPWVYAVEHQGKEYILLLDGLNSCWTCGLRCFTLSGDRIEPDPNNPLSGLYGDLSNEKGRTLLWRQGY